MKDFTYMDMKLYQRQNLNTIKQSSFLTLKFTTILLIADDFIVSLKLKVNKRQKQRTDC